MGSGPGRSKSYKATHGFQWAFLWGQVLEGQSVIGPPMGSKGSFYGVGSWKVEVIYGCPWVPLWDPIGLGPGRSKSYRAAHGFQWVFLWGRVLEGQSSIRPFMGSKGSFDGVGSWKVKVF